MFPKRKTHSIVIKTNAKSFKSFQRSSVTRNRNAGRFMASGAAVKTYGEVRNLFKNYVPYLSMHKRIIAFL